MLVWNAHGVGNAATLCHFKHLCRFHKLALLVLIEPIAGVEALPNVSAILGFSHFFTMNNNKIWLLWVDDLKANSIIHSEQYVHVVFKHYAVKDELCCTFVYGKHSQVDRLLLWSDLVIV